MVRMDGEKMSKSLGNMVFVRDLLHAYSSSALRLYLLGHHYRQVWEWAPSELDDAAALAERLAVAARKPDTSPRESREEFRGALADDLNTPEAIRVLARASGDTLRNLARVLGLEL
jgi:L-cysteine:1D-myo-inositol 2-amino-2-deoxy-alpha-D-glucopyranoside ligase